MRQSATEKENLTCFNMPQALFMSHLTNLRPTKQTKHISTTLPLNGDLIFTASKLSEEMPQLHTYVMNN